ncbi:MAG: hypothetical protein P1U74_00580 [Legionellaceae bacterium]|nr:hypothetical protein [Legionellaceae bacterium]
MDETYSELDIKLQDFLQDTTEMNSDSAKRLKVSTHIASIVNDYMPCSNLNYDKVKFSELKLNGIVKLENLSLNKRKVKEVVKYFKGIPVFSGHVPAQSDRVRRFYNANAKNFSFGSYEIEDTLLAPYLLDLALSPEILSYVEGYLGCTPTIYSMNVWWSFPGFEPGVAQDFHRDVDDFKSLTLFIYLTDVKGGVSGGQHQFITCTHNEDQVVEILEGNEELASELFIPKLQQNGYNQADVYEKHFKNQIKDITGVAGSVFLADTYAFHKGVSPTKDPRLVCWVRYGLRKNLTFYNDETTPIPLNLIQNKINLTDKEKYMLRILYTECSIPNYKVETDSGIKDIQLYGYHWETYRKRLNWYNDKLTTKIVKKIHLYKNKIIEKILDLSFRIKRKIRSKIGLSIKSN